MSNRLHSTGPGRVAPGPHDIEATRAVYVPDGSVRLVPVTPTFYADLDRHFPSFSGHVLVSEHAFAEPWPTWEIHPHGDELVYLLEGETDFVLWRNDSEHVVHVRGAGAFVVVPAGTWHTARPRRPTRMLFLTPGEGTQNAERPW
jgi:mannose-6-phosphate isomerase-like protein (cupin superfamily)